VTAFVIDASIAVKWVVSEDGTDLALLLLKSARLVAPDLLMPECANVLWKKAQRGELSTDEAVLAARVLQKADIEIYPTRQLLDEATRIAIDLNHPAYDCIYLSLAIANDWQFVSADERFIRKIREGEPRPYRHAILSLGEAVATLSR
jgi:predicted nucleic acid-binding protein